MEWERVMSLELGRNHNSGAYPNGWVDSVRDPSARIDPKNYNYKIHVQGDHGPENNGGKWINAIVTTFKLQEGGRPLKLNQYNSAGNVSSLMNDYVASWYNPTHTSGPVNPPQGSLVSKNRRREITVVLNIPQTEQYIYLYGDKTGSESIIMHLYRKLKNAAPIISGSDQNLGAKNDEFNVSYSVSDQDSTNTLTVTESLNGNTLRKLTNAPKGQLQTITIDREKLYALEVGKTNTIEVKVDDGAGGVAYRRWTFTRTNSAPVVSGSDSDLGVKTQEFSVNFSATDQENDPMTAIAYLDEKVLKNFGTINSGEEYTITFDKLGFSKIKHGEVHKLRIEVRDRNNATSVRNYTFTRALDRLSYTFKKETDKKVTKAFVTPTWFVADGAVAKVEVSNNAKDEAPVWENMTTQVLEGRHFNLQNATKTSDQWMFGVRISIERGQAKENSWLGGFGGGY